MAIILRKSRVAFKFTGADAKKLLNDVLSGTISQDDRAAHWWALLTPQGKIIVEGLSGWHNGAFWLDVGAEFAAGFFKRMLMYKLRADVEISDLSASHAVGWSELAPESADLISHQDKRGQGLGYRVIAPLAMAQNWLDDETQFAVKRIAQAIGEMGADFEPETMFPHDIGMDLLGGIDFKKGCYIGQEVVSRMQHRSTARRRPLIVSDIETEGENQVVAGTRVAGKVGQVINGSAVGFLRLDRLAGRQTPSIAESAVKLAVPQWASYALNDSNKE